MFGIEIKALQKVVTLPTNSPILPLPPFLDSNSVLKVGGRLARAHLVALIVRHQHLISSHADLHC